MDRRTFLNWVGVGAIASSFPVALATFLENQQPANAASDYKAVAKLADLKTKGKILIKEGVATPVLLVLPDAKKTTEVIAVNPTCTHQSCIVDWNGGQSAFVCPCHSSRFDKAGKAVRGPASAPLKTYEVKVEGDKILVKV
jgi:cytochrome b6-f complex iron-sulfur subunit